MVNSLVGQMGKDEQEYANCVQESRFNDLFTKTKQAADAARDGIERMNGLMRSTEHINSTTEQALNQETGNHQFCYLFTGLAKGRNKEGKLLREIFVENSGPLPLSICHITISESAKDGKIADKQFGPLAPGAGTLRGSEVNFAERTGIILPVGTYIVSITTRNDRFFEFLQIEPGLPDTIQVKNANGRVVYTDLLHEGMKFPKWF